jgi:hypothetical protein
MWAQEAYALRPAATRRLTSRTTVAFGTIRQLRSALSQVQAWDTMVTRPGAYMDASNRILYSSTRPTDSLSMSLFTAGLRHRLGDEPQPSRAILDRHVWWCDQHFRNLLASASNPGTRQQILLAGLANVLLWLGWLRSSELFSLRWEDIFVLAHTDLDLPRGNDALILQLQHQTKTNRMRRADMVIACTTQSGYRPHSWYLQAWNAWLPITDAAPIFVLADGITPWTSVHYRTIYLYPCLTLLQMQGDANLRPLPTDADKTLPQLFWSLHCYRRGSNSHAKRGGLSTRVSYNTTSILRPPLHRFAKATQAQIYEHARWRRPRGSEPLDVHYDEWTLGQRIALTRDSF